MRRMSIPVFIFTAALAAGAALVAQGTGQQQQQQQPPPAGGQADAQGGRGQGRGGGRGRANWVTIKEGEECPPGTTEARYLQCAPPAAPAPSILDYRPRSTVVADEHLVPRAKFPVVDVHTHGSSSFINNPERIKEMDALNLRVLVDLSGGTNPQEIKNKVDAINASPYKDRFRVFANVSWNGAGTPEWEQKALADLRQAVKNGAIGLKVFKELGLTNRKAEGSRLAVDDPALDPIWDRAGELNIPVIIHPAEPQEFFSPLDNHNERWLELNIFADRFRPPAKYPTFEQLMTERDHMFAKHPKTRFIAAHFAWYGNDLQRAARLLDTLPNVTLEVAAVLYEFGRQPYAAAQFFTKYQDRIMFGKDTYETTEYPYYWRVFETHDEYFDYYRGYHAFWKLYGMALPDEVLKKLYYKNALRIEPGLPQSGWPQ